MPKPDTSDSEMGLGEEAYGLKREIGVYGSFSMGYSDVGADIYVALGILALYAQAAAPIALLIAAVTYVTTGLTYAELASRYPVAGGGNYYATKAFGPIHGFMAGWGLMLDYTIDIALFGLATSGYVGAIVKTFFGTSVPLQQPYYGLIGASVIVVLMVLNIFGISYSSKLNEAVTAVSLATISILIIIGLYSAFMSDSFMNWTSQITPSLLTSQNFAYGITLAMASYIGIESISQAAEETKKPSKVIPKATKLSIVSVLVIALSLSFLTVSLIPWQVAASSPENPLYVLSSAYPVIGGILSIWVAFMGIWICTVSTNTGVVGVSRVTFSMGRLGLLPKEMARISRRFRTPYVTIITFSLIAILLILVNIFLPSAELLNLVASIYNFGALVAYMYVNLSAIKLRLEEQSNGYYRSPLNISILYRGRKVKISLIPIIGFVSCSAIWLILILLHPLGRELGVIWFMVGLLIFLLYRRKRGSTLLAAKKKIGQSNV
ncbi:MAG: APC family permease [Conexivisphaerales archaeon]